MERNSKDNFLDRLISAAIDENISLLTEDRYANDKYIRGFKQELGDKVRQKVKSDTNLQQAADELAINMDYSSNKRQQEKKKIANALKTRSSMGNDINRTVLAVVDILRQNTTRGGSVNNENIKKQATSALTYADILRTKDFLDSLDLRFLYDPSVDVLTKVSFPRDKNETEYKFGIIVRRDGSIDLSNFDLGKLSREQITQYNSARNLNDTSGVAALGNVANKYVYSSYGINFNCPSFSLGNAKVTDALLINFTSAYRCPAWNECLVKHACYARSGESRRYPNMKSSNDRKNLLWLACEKDPNLTALMYNFIKANVVNFNEVGRKLKAAGLFEVYGGDLDKIVRMKISDMEEPLVNILKECKRVSYIRLNENGDFINQALLNSFDKMAKEFLRIGIQTAAYTCRNLNFKKIRNIVINASSANIKGPSVARYFYAVPVEMYKNFDDTYESTKISDKPDAIVKIPKPLFSMDNNGNIKPNGSYYYKCPCGRSDFKIGRSKLEKKINCYQCQMCYNPLDEEMKRLLGKKGKLFVFVEAHGTNKGLLDKDRERLIIKSVGVPETYFQKMEPLTEDKAPITEGYGGSPEREAFRKITQNAIYSMNEHFRDLADDI